MSDEAWSSRHADHPGRPVSDARARVEDRAARRLPLPPKTIRPSRTLHVTEAGIPAVSSADQLASLPSTPCPTMSKPRLRRRFDDSPRERRRRVSTKCVESAGTQRRWARRSDRIASRRAVMRSTTAELDRDVLPSGRNAGAIAESPESIGAHTQPGASASKTEFGCLKGREAWNLGRGPVSYIHLSPAIHKMKIVPTDAARGRAGLVNTEKSRSRATTRRGGLCSRGHRALALANAAFLAAMFGVDLLSFAAYRT